MLRQTPAASKAAADRGAITQPQPGIGGTKARQAQKEVFAFLLLPGERGASSENVLRFGPAVKAVLFEIPFHEDPSQRYSVRLATAGGESISRFSGLTSSRLHRGETGLTIRVPSNLLADGDYIVIVSVGSRQGTADLADYSFRAFGAHVRRRSYANRSAVFPPSSAAASAVSIGVGLLHSAVICNLLAKTSKSQVSAQADHLQCKQLAIKCHPYARIRLQDGPRNSRIWCTGREAQVDSARRSIGLSSSDRRRRHRTGKAFARMARKVQGAKLSLRTRARFGCAFSGR